MLLFLAQAAAEPAPAGWGAGADFAVKHAEQRPDVFFPLLASVGFLAIIVGAGYAFVKFAIPAWRAEKAADREHLTAMVLQRGKEAVEDVAAARALAEAQHKALRETIGDRVERVTGELPGGGTRLELRLSGRTPSPSIASGTRAMCLACMAAARWRARRLMLRSDQVGCARLRG